MINIYFNPIQLHPLRSHGIKNYFSMGLDLILTALRRNVQSVRFSNSITLRFFDFQALDPKFVLALEPKVLKVKGSSYGNKPSIYVRKS